VGEEVHLGLVGLEVVGFDGGVGAGADLRGLRFVRLGGQVVGVVAACGESSVLTALRLLRAIHTTSRRKRLHSRSHRDRLRHGFKSVVLELLNRRGLRTRVFYHFFEI